eukprot:2618129-Rhodomonas_salina.1
MAQVSELAQNFRERVPSSSLRLLRSSGHRLHAAPSNAVSRGQLRVGAVAGGRPRGDLAARRGR